MDTLKTILVFIHLLGLAALIGGAFAQWTATAKQASPPMLWGARTQLISGIALTVIVYMTEKNIHHFKFAAKLIVLFVILGILESSRRRVLSNNAFWTAMSLSVLDVALVHFWTTSADD